MNLRTLRKLKGLSQKQVSEEIGVSFQTYSSYETGRTEPSLSTLCKLADFYQVSLDELLGRNNNDFFENAILQKPEYQRLFEHLTPQQQELVIERIKAYSDINKQKS